jgi:DNA repair exonuclease SbcCD ATPase subunit
MNHKSTISVTVDQDIIDNLDIQGVNRSKLINEFLKDFIINSSITPELRPKIAELEALINKDFTEIASIQENIIKNKTLLESLKVENNEKQEIMIEERKSNTCCICNTELDHNSKHTVAIDSEKGLFSHRSCYFSLPSDKFKELYKRV